MCGFKDGGLDFNLGLIGPTALSPCHSRTLPGLLCFWGIPGAEKQRLTSGPGGMQQECRSGCSVVLKPGPKGLQHMGREKFAT